MSTTKLESACVSLVHFTQKCELRMNTLLYTSGLHRSCVLMLLIVNMEVETHCDHSPGTLKFHCISLALSNTPIHIAVTHIIHILAYDHGNLSITKSPKCIHEATVIL